MESIKEKKNISKLTLGGALVALGVVYGDIGTSPLYVMRSVISNNGGLQNVSENFILGTLSLVFWTLTLLTTMKYVLLTLRADNNGEGGIFSLFALVRKESKYLIIPAMIGGSALLADGMLTPAVTVTSAVEGLRLIPSLNNFFHSNENNILIIVICILAVLFFIQYLGTNFVGKLFSPIMLVWFSSLAFFGLINLNNNFGLLRALSPHYAISILFSSENKVGFFILGSIFLATTGAEALYSDLGHVGRKNIYITWPFVKVCLLINYFGQGAWLLSAKQNGTFINAEDLNPFFQMIPNSLLLFGIIISTLAAIIASQALISGSFTLVSEAIKLNLFPKLHTLYPSESKGQLYIPSINKVLCLVCIGIVLYFKSSENMEAAYGLAITVTMLMTSILLFNYLLMKKTPFIISLLIFIFFATFECSFFIANASKFSHGGFITVLIASIILLVMFIWIRSHYIKMELLENVQISDFKEQLDNLRKDETLPKLATNLVYLTNSTCTKKIEHKIMYSILDKKPKKADVYWFVHICVTDDPYEASYVVDTFGTSYIVRIELNLGFRVEQKLNIFLRQISTELVESGEIKLQSRIYTTLKNRIVGDFHFVLLKEQLSHKAELNFFDSIVLRLNLFIKRFTVSPSKWFGLDTSDVYIEKVPLFVDNSNADFLIRKYMSMNKK